VSRFLGLDIGDRRIGVAVSDELNLTAQGVEVITRQNLEKDIANIVEIINRYETGTVVVGMPYRTDAGYNTVSQQGEKIKAFASLLENNINARVVFQDERFTTKESERVLLEAGLSRDKAKKVKDKISAQLILQTYLDKI